MRFFHPNPRLFKWTQHFEVEKGRYKLAAFCYLNLTTNEPEIAALSMMSDETRENYDFVLSKFKTMCRRKDTIFHVDKDFTNIESIKKAFSEVTILLCVFHVLKYLRSSLRRWQELKTRKQFSVNSKRLYTLIPRTSLRSLNSDFLTVIGDIEVRQNGKHTSLSDYYRNNWEICSPMWVKYQRYGLPLLGDHTANRIERMFWSLPDILGRPNDVADDDFDFTPDANRT